MLKVKFWKPWYGIGMLWSEIIGTELDRWEERKLSVGTAMAYGFKLSLQDIACTDWSVVIFIMALRGGELEVPEKPLNGLHLIHGNTQEWEEKMT